MRKWIDLLVLPIFVGHVGTLLVSLVFVAGAYLFGYRPEGLVVISLAIGALAVATLISPLFSIWAANSSVKKHFPELTGSKKNGKIFLYGFFIPLAFTLLPYTRIIFRLLTSNDVPAVVGKPDH